MSNGVDTTPARKSTGLNTNLVTVSHSCTWQDSKQSLSLSLSLALSLAPFLCLFGLARPCSGVTTLDMMLLQSLQVVHGLGRAFRWHLCLSQLSRGGSPASSGQPPRKSACVIQEFEPTPPAPKLQTLKRWKLKSKATKRSRREASSEALLPNTIVAAWSAWL